jgi:hypothetical protein
LEVVHITKSSPACQVQRFVRNFFIGAYMKPNTQNFTREEFSPCTAKYNHNDGIITIDFFPEAMAFLMKDCDRYKRIMDNIQMGITQCFNRSIELIHDRQSIPEP